MSDDRETSEERKHEKRPMPTEDKVALGVIIVFFLGAVLAVRWILASFFGVAVGAASGVGFRDAFLISIGLSIGVMVLFALVAGDGALGELTVMIIGFFVMLVFFTLSIAVLL